MQKIGGHLHLVPLQCNIILLRSFLYRSDHALHMCLKCGFHLGKRLLIYQCVKGLANGSSLFFPVLGDVVIRVTFTRRHLIGFQLPTSYERVFHLVAQLVRLPPPPPKKRVRMPRGVHVLYIGLRAALGGLRAAHLPRYGFEL